MKYRFLDEITSDVIFEAYGKDLKELLENSAEAVATVICKVEQVKAEKTIKVSVEGENEKDLLFNWLQEIIASVDVHEMFFSKFKITKLEGNKLEAELSGEDITPEKGETVVKSITYFGFNLEKNSDGYKAKVSMDI